MTALILIDFQEGFNLPIWGERNNPEAEKNAEQLLVSWRTKSAPVFHVRHINSNPESIFQPGSEEIQFKEGLNPHQGERVIEKKVNSAFIGTDLEQRLHAEGIRSVVIAGLTTPHCVSTTCRMASNLGFDVTLAEDACAAFATSADMSFRSGSAQPDPQLIHDMAVSHLHTEFVTACNVQTLLEAQS